MRGAARGAFRVEPPSGPAVCERFDDLGFDGSPARLGIMGGTFDPIHIGHLAVAEQAREAYGLDAVVFIPAGNPVFKKDREVASASHRLAMCRLAVASNPFFDVSDLEIKRGGDTYTVDTLRQLRAHYPANVELCFITGADAVASIVKWRESASIADLARLIAVTRPGFPLTEEKRAEIEEGGRFDVSYLEATALSVSSSDLRARVAEGRSIRYLTMQRVRDYIADQGLYAPERAKESRGADGLSPEREGGPMPIDALSDEFAEGMQRRLAERVSAHRAEHVRGVAQTAMRLARCYGVDERKARLAGILHDWDKSYGDADIRARADDLGVAIDPFVRDMLPAVLHGPTAAAALAREEPAIPADVLRAIERHTTGAVDMSALDMVLYVADAIEPGRRFGEVDELRELVGKVGLEELFFRTLAYWTVLLVRRGKLMHPDTMKVWNAYAARAAAGKER